MLKKIFFGIVNTFCVVVIAAAVLVLLTVVLTKPGEVPRLFGYAAFRVMTGSMEPTIETDSLILVREIEPSEVAVDDIISFYFKDSTFGGTVNTHRVVAVEADGDDWLYTTKGDANAIADPSPVPSGKLIGKVVFVSHPLGVLIRLLSNPLIFIPVIAVPLLVMLLMNLRHVIRLAKEAAREEEKAAMQEMVKVIQKRKRAEREKQDQVVDPTQQHIDHP